MATTLHASNPWAHWVGTKFNKEKVAFLSIASVILNPGLVGLGILDSFASGVPMVTTDCGIHSPEISYLKNDVNGIMTEPDVHQYSIACIALLRDHSRLRRLRENCLESAKEYTLENMANRFVKGIVSCLNEKGNS